MRVVLSLVLIATGYSFLLADEIDPRRPAAIIRDAGHILPAEIFAELARYQEVRSAGFGGWVPGGEGVRIHTRGGGARRLHRGCQPGGRRRRVTGG
ncbi:MAG: S9 family peptidase, partial [Planctomycetes bacterium]|nr:S9 family peptidase [Planctomycetota bacterium]